ncbi:hypothetical protein PR202_gb16004 [Eleusine coracana subsp. coracana]|uniref:Uncharacterized protein n=1 Tax=Eleusine coracana subsp. coracana TaxID=191504 RepID=A0AAV5EZA2_ELECO|nr:hypothetical protein PR202_gb16004 [Eleusine coracana subsp. coracana]
MGSNGKEHKRGVPRPPPLSLYRDWEVVEETVKTTSKQSPLGRSSSMHRDMDSNNNKKLSKQLSMKETTREVKWEKRRRQIQRRRSSTGLNESEDVVSSSSIYPVHGEARPSIERVAKGRLTDADLDELRGSMELGFGFDEEKGGQNLCDTLPALDLYFAVNRQLSEPKMRWSTSSAPSLSATSSSSNLCGTPSPGSPSAQSNLMDPWKICSPGENPQLVKTRLRHWAQVVACSVKHSS